jgi:ankyrin repeat protein
VYGETALIAALRWGARDVFAFLLQHGVDVEAADARGLVPLTYALLREDWLAARELAARGAKVDVPLDDGEDALMSAIEMEHEPLLVFMRAHSKRKVEADVGTATRGLVQAVKRGGWKTVAEFLSRGAPADTRDSQGTPMLVLAARQEDPMTVMLLLESGADVNATSKAGGTALLGALARGDLETAQQLLGSGARVDVDGATAYSLVLSWHERERPDLLKALFEAGLKIDQPGGCGESLMSVAISRRDRALATLLLDQGLEAREWYQEVLKMEDTGLISEWVARDVEVDDPDEAGLSALARFVHEGKLALAKLLVEAGADVNVKTEDGQMLLAWAVAHRDQEMVSILLKAGADPNVPLVSPVSEGFLKKFSDEKNTSYYLMKDSRMTPLMIAAGSGQEAVATALLESGAKTGVYTQRYKIYPINFATQRDDVNLIQRMLGRDPDPKKQERKIVVDLSTQRATLYKDGKVHMTSRVSTGKTGYSTPAGEYVITNKHRHWTSTLYDASMPYFMRLNCGAFGLHQSDSVPSYPASHGCVRMPWKDVSTWFAICEVGDRVTIQP